MAASEGQLAVEFVQALTAEARAHREYLQLLYVVTLGVVGGGLLLLVAAVAWFGRRAIRNVQESVKSSFEQRVSETIELRLAEVDKEISSFRRSLSELEKFEGVAKKELDAIASLASQAKSLYNDKLNENDRASRVRKEALNIFKAHQKWIIDVLIAEGFDVSSMDRLSELDRPMLAAIKPSVITIDYSFINDETIRIIRSQFYALDIKPRLIVVDETDDPGRFFEVLAMTKFIENVDIVDGSSGLLVALREIEAANR